MENFKTKTNDELKRLTKVIQKRQSVISPAKSYASVASVTSEAQHTGEHTGEPNGIGDTCSEHISRRNDSSIIDSNEDSPLSKNSTKSYSSEKESSLSPNTLHVNYHNPRSTPIDERDHHSVVRSHMNELQVDAPGAETHDSITVNDKHRGGSKRNKKVNRSVKFDDNSCSVTISDRSHNVQSKKTEENIFVGVTYKKTARYYLSGIGKTSTRLGIQSYIEEMGVKTTHLVLFKPKYERSLLSAKVNVPCQYADQVESPGFWPKGVKCRAWMSMREWEQKCADQLDPEAWDSQSYEGSG